MKRILYKGLLQAAICFLIFGLSGCVDQSGNGETAEAGNEPMEPRIAATSVTVCEILDALEVEGVVAVPDSEVAALPKRYEELETIGMAMSPDMEKLASISPDWIFSPASLENDLAPKYQNMKINAGFLNLSSVPGMYQSIAELGELLGKEEKAQELKKEFTDFVETYRTANNGKTSPKVLILMGMPGSYVAATEQSYVGSLVALAGGYNAYEEAEEAFLNINAEDMLEKDPDLILLASHAVPEQVAAMFQEEFTENEIWQHFKAVKNEQVYTLDYEKFGMSANFKYQEALADLQEILYSEESGGE